MLIKQFYAKKHNDADCISEEVLNSLYGGFKTYQSVNFTKLQK
jgi:hypothetical protein